jgi:hypothetical protein
MNYVLRSALAWREKNDKTDRSENKRAPLVQECRWRVSPYNRLMMYSLEEYTFLKEKYARVASWAIWDSRNQHDTTIIDKNVAQLSSRYVFAALNVSKDLKDESWINFHAGRHDRKLKYACNDTILRGSYLTDLFKGIAEPKDFKIKSLLTSETIQEHVKAFNREMVDIKLSDDSTLIILGGMARRYFDIHFRRGYRNKIIFHAHYSDYKLSDKQWTEDLWSKLNIVQDFDSIVQKYQR